MSDPRIPMDEQSREWWQAVARGEEPPKREPLLCERCGERIEVHGIYHDLPDDLKPEYPVASFPGLDIRGFYCPRPSGTIVARLP